MRRSGYQTVCCKSLAIAAIALSLFAGPGVAQSSPPAPDQLNAPASHPQPPDESQTPTALVRTVKVIPGESGAALEILATRPLTPGISTVENPLRLVVDLPKSLVATRMRINYRDPQVLRVRVDQFHQDPPAVRIVIDLSRNASASWDAAGNRLMIRLHPGEAKTPEAATPENTGATARESEPAAIGDLVLAGNRLTTGSEIRAGADTQTLHMGRAGEARICPGTTVTVTSSQNGHDVMLGMSTGSLETHYQLATGSDSILTPDFRILFDGPGEYNYAISADSHGNTCVRALPGNSAPAVVSELMGDGKYQVKPSEEVVFRSGRLTQIDSRVPEDCGCPTASTPVMRASSDTTTDVTTAGAVASAETQTEGDAAKPNPPAGAETASLPKSSPNDVHIQVDAPIVFRAADVSAAKASAMAANLPSTGPVHTDALPVSALPPDEPPPASPVQTSHKSFFGKVGGFFGRIFR